MRGQAIVGRVKSWLASPEGRLPVSCTVREVRPDFDDVFDSWIFVSKALRFGAGCAINLEGWKRPEYPGHSGRMNLVLDENHPDFVLFQQEFKYNSLDRYDDLLIVEDSMEEGRFSIENCWVLMAKLLLEGRNVVVDLSKLRPKGTVNNKGLVASGPASFGRIFMSMYQFVSSPTITTLCKVYSVINEVLRRGGLYRNGAITIYLNYDHPEVLDFLNLSRYCLEWAKKALTVDVMVLDSPHLSLILEAAERGELFLAKRRYSHSGERLYFQVCTEIALKSHDTCLLHHINLGELTIPEIPQAFEEGMRFLCDLHQRTGIEKVGIYLPPAESKQIGLGVMGLASFLAIHGIRYFAFVEALEALISFLSTVVTAPSLEAYLQVLNHLEKMETLSTAWRFAVSLACGFFRASIIAMQHGMERAFCVAPTATSSFQYRDAYNFTATPNIAPPIAHNVLRDSQEFGLMEADYHPDCETAAQVGFDVYFRLCCAWQKLMNLTSLAHAISFDVWDQQPFDKDFLVRWLRSPLWTTYYRLQTLGLDAVDKSRVMCERDSECESCAG